jgi:hypothetical protein
MMRQVHANLGCSGEGVGPRRARQIAGIVVIARDQKKQKPTQGIGILIGGYFFLGEPFFVLSG